MKLWSGHKISTLKSRNWTPVPMSLNRIREMNISEYMEWFANHPSKGRWCPDQSATEHFIGYIYYFEDAKVATEFALRWA